MSRIDREAIEEALAHKSISERVAYFAGYFTVQLLGGFVMAVGVILALVLFSRLVLRT